ncbi:hypothetical protein AGOR_G00037930 [Albula goreensis]|uniref:Uncharacterized protein n=1 Tax=Albula goreensis TaxID=1534307 RepID=A0A8T3DXS6_9TELE|nr:hypothetical protein AGOR_G00037930 [Albula goreensis]
MSTASSSAGLGLDSGGHWHRRALQRSRTLAQNYLLSNSAPPLPPTSTSHRRNTLRLPSLGAVNHLHHQTTLAPLRPAAKLVAKPRRHSQSLSTEHKEIRPLVVQYRQPLHGETLAVRGKQCLPVPSSPSAPAPARTQLHVFLPTEGAVQREERDNESVDEGFMDELDSKVISLKLQQGEAKTSTHPVNPSQF